MPGAEVQVEGPLVLEALDQLEVIGYVEPRNQDELLYPRILSAVGHEIQDQRPCLCEERRNDVNMSDDGDFAGLAGLSGHSGFYQRALAHVEWGFEKLLQRRQYRLSPNGSEESIVSISARPDLDQDVKVRPTDLLIDIEPCRPVMDVKGGGRQLVEELCSLGAPRWSRFNPGRQQFDVSDVILLIRGSNQLYGPIDC